MVIATTTLSIGKAVLCDTDTSSDFFTDCGLYLQMPQNVVMCYARRHGCCDNCELLRSCKRFPIILKATDVIPIIFNESTIKSQYPEYFI